MGKPCNTVTGNCWLHKLIDVLQQSYGLFCGKEAVQLKQDNVNVLLHFNRLACLLGCNLPI